MVAKSVEMIPLSDKVLIYLDNLINAYGLTDCVQVVEGRESIIVHHNIKDRMYTIKVNNYRNRIDFYDEGSYFSITPKQLKKVLLNELIIEDFENKCSFCKVGCIKKNN